jgi:hypothetical protein
MAFSGLSTNRMFTPNLIGEDISEIIRTLSPYEAPLLDWLGDSDVFAASTKHEYVEDFLRPRYIVASTAVTSVATATGFQIGGSLGLSLTVGTLLENESASPEIMQVISIVGSDSIVVSRNYDGSGVGSLVAGGQSGGPARKRDTSTRARTPPVSALARPTRSAISTSRSPPRARRSL